MNKHLFLLKDWVRYFTGKVSVKKGRLMKKALAASEWEQARLQGLELLLHDVGLGPGDRLEGIMAALKQLERHNKGRTLQALERIRAEHGLLNDAGRPLLTSEAIQARNN